MSLLLRLRRSVDDRQTLNGWGGSGEMGEGKRHSSPSCKKLLLAVSGQSCCPGPSGRM